MWGAHQGSKVIEGKNHQRHKRLWARPNREVEELTKGSRTQIEHMIRVLDFTRDQCATMTHKTYYLNYLSRAQGYFWIMSIYDNSKTIWVFLKKKDPLRKSKVLDEGAVINHIFRWPIFTLERPNSMVHGTWHGWQVDGSPPYWNAVLLCFVFTKTWRKTKHFWK